jgi:hypothetical protein
VDLGAHQSSGVCGRLTRDAIDVADAQSIPARRPRAARGLKCRVETAKEVDRLEYAVVSSAIESDISRVASGLGHPRSARPSSNTAGSVRER